MVELPQGKFPPGGEPETWPKEKPGLIVLIFLALALYLVLPLWDLPLLGLSLSAPVFLLITVYSLTRRERTWNAQHAVWVRRALLLWLGLVVGSLLNGLRGYFDFGSDDLLSLVRYTYWILVFVIVTHFVSLTRIGRRVANWLFFGLLLLAGLRWLEVIVYDRIGAGSSEIMTQNSYGFLFSTFSAFLLPPLFTGRGTQRLLAGLGALAVWGAVLVNGSRGSWIAVSLGVVVYSLLYIFSGQQRTRALLAALGLSLLASAAFVALPERINQVINERYASIDQLEEDKSFAIRELMNQKGLRLFQESPLIGVGLGRFRFSSTALDLPEILRYETQEYFDQKSAHNSYMALVAESGLMGALPFSLLVLTLLVRGLRGGVKLQRQGENWALPMYVSFLSMSVHMWSISTLTNTLPWFIYGLVAAMIVCAEENRPS